MTMETIGEVSSDGEDLPSGDEIGKFWNVTRQYF